MVDMVAANMDNDDAEAAAAWVVDFVGDGRSQNRWSAGPWVVGGGWDRLNLYAGTEGGPCVDSKLPMDSRLVLNSPRGCLIGEKEGRSMWGDGREQRGGGRGVKL